MNLEENKMNLEENKMNLEENKMKKEYIEKNIVKTEVEKEVKTEDKINPTTTVPGMLTKEEIQLSEKCLGFALEHGATKVRIALNKSLMNLNETLNGEIDKVTHCMDRSMVFHLFANSKYGSFSTNRLEEEELKDFILKALKMVSIMAEDEYRDLPDPERVQKNATSGREMGLFDDSYGSMTPEKRSELALLGSAFLKENDSKNDNDSQKENDFQNDNKGYKLISEEGEYSDSIYDSYTIDSQGSKCRHLETSFEYGVQVTVENEKGEKSSGYWWDASPIFKEVKIEGCAEKAIERAVSHLGAGKSECSKTNMVVLNEVGTKITLPILNALNAYSIQQKNSFLDESLGKKIFSDGLTIIDKCHQKGKCGSRLFDSEGIATKEVPLIENGVIKQYFVNTYMSGKTGFEPTIEDFTRPSVQAYLKNEKVPEGDFGLEDILKKCNSGILVTGFNGGNSNSSTGDFSYGVEGFEFNDGKIGKPIHEMIITGNFKTLWNNFIAAGNDYRPCMTREIPTLAFKDVDFSS